MPRCRYGFAKENLLLFRSYKTERFLNADKAQMVWIEQGFRIRAGQFKSGILLYLLNPRPPRSENKNLSSHENF